MMNDSRTQTWRCLLLKVGLLLIGGAIINVAVAWGFALSIGFANHAEHDREFLSSAKESWSVEVYNRPGARRVDTFRAQPGLFPDQHGEPGNLIPNWSDYPKSLASDRRKEMTDFEARGWPALSMWCQMRDWHVDNEGHRSDAGVRGGIRLGLAAFEGGMGEMPRVLPLRPIWSGFAINTILYAASLGLFIAVPGFVKRRIRTRRRQCPACAYPVGSSDVCTECGHTVKPQSSLHG